MKNSNTLTPVDWIMAAFRALVAGGEQAIKVEAIAKKLRVSKGSFYWHFKDVSHLKEEMLAHWEKVATHDIISTISTNATTDNFERLTPKQQLKSLVEIVTSDASAPYGGVLVEPAIRSWARYDEKAAQTLATVDVARLEFVEKLFDDAGVPSEKCIEFSRILYGALIGLEQISSYGTANLRKELTYLLDLMFESTRSK